MAAALDMTQGSEAGLLIRFALPLLAGNLLQQVYTATDTAIVGKVLGDDALAAVGATGSITYLFSTLCIGLGIGAGIIIAQLYGAGFLERMRSAVWNSALVTLLFGIVISVISVPLTEPVLRLLNTPDALLPMAASYMKIACGGTIAVAFYNWINSVMRALGDARTPLVFLGVSCGLNIGLDLLFIIVFHFGVQGAAAATVIAQACSAVGCTVYAFRKMKELHLTRADLRTDTQMMRQCIVTGVPIAVQNGMISLSMVALQRVTNGFGEAVMAAYTATLRVEMFGHQPFSSLNAALATFTGQNTGAGKEDRVRRGLRTGLMIGALIGLVIAAAFWLFGRAALLCFISREESVRIGTWGLRVNACCYIPLSIIYTTRGFLNGAGDTVYAMMNGAAEVISRIGFALLLTPIASVGWHGIWYTTCITWCATAIVGLLRYRSGKWKSKAIG